MIEHEVMEEETELNEDLISIFNAIADDVMKAMDLAVDSGLSEQETINSLLAVIRGTDNG